MIQKLLYLWSDPQSRNLQRPDILLFHSFDDFDACQVRECHGNTELWQCSRPFRTACQKIWRAPSNLAFSVDLTNMEASDSAQPEAGAAADADAAADSATPRVGHVRRSERKKMLQGWPSANDGAGSLKMFCQPNRPVCPECQEPARPAILMFNDFAWIDNTSQEDRYYSWLQASYIGCLFMVTFVVFCLCVSAIHCCRLLSAGRHCRSQ